MVSIKDVVRSSVKVSEFDKHLKKAGGYIGRNVVEITIKMKTIVRKTLMIIINKLRLRNLDNYHTKFILQLQTELEIALLSNEFSMYCSTSLKISLWMLFFAGLQLYTAVHIWTVLKSTEPEVVFTKAEINIGWNVNFLQNNPLGIKKPRKSAEEMYRDYSSKSF